MADDLKDWAYKYPFWFGKRTLPEWIDEILEYLPSLGVDTREEQKELLEALYSIVPADICEDTTIGYNEYLIRDNLVQLVQQKLNLLMDLHQAGFLNVGKD